MAIQIGMVENSDPKPLALMKTMISGDFAMIHHYPPWQFPPFGSWETVLLPGNSENGHSERAHHRQKPYGWLVKR